MPPPHPLAPHPLVARDKKISTLKKALADVPRQQRQWEKQLRKNVRHNPYLQLVLDAHETEKNEHNEALRGILQHLFSMQHLFSIQHLFSMQQTPLGADQAAALAADIKNIKAAFL